MQKRLKIAGVVVVALLLFIAFPLVFPAPLFAHSATLGSLSVFSDEALPKKEARLFLQQVGERLDQSPVSFPGQNMQIYVVNAKWRRNWLWLAIPKGAGGFVVAPFTRWHTFLSGADFKAGLLIGPTGYRPYAPRTLSYYGTHELTHTIMAKKLGWLSWQLMPEWIREGVPDYVALPQESAQTLYGKIGEHSADLDMMKAHGVYAPYRLLVSYFLDEKGWTIEKLMASNLTLLQARATVFKALRLRSL